jgi:hypothetical protein
MHLLCAVVDVIYMSMTLINHAIQSGDIASSPMWYVNVVDSILGILLDIITGFFLYKWSRTGLRILVAVHVTHFTATCFTKWEVIAVFRMLVVLFIERVRSHMLHDRLSCNMQFPFCNVDTDLLFPHCMMMLKARNVFHIFSFAYQSVRN